MEVETKSQRQQILDLELQLNVLTSTFSDAIRHCREELAKSYETQNTLKKKIDSAWMQHDHIKHYLDVVIKERDTYKEQLNVLLPKEHELESTKYENDYLKEQLEWYKERVQYYEAQANVRRAHFEETQEEIQKHKKKKYESKGRGKRVATNDAEVDDAYDDNYKRKKHNITSYLDNGIIDSTRELREHIDKSCPDEWQRCHIVGLNLLKEILNHYTRIKNLVLTPNSFLIIKHDLNDVNENIECCTPERNHSDVEVEKDVLAYIFKGRELVTTESREMFDALIALLDRVYEHTSHDIRVGKILSDIKNRSFPLQRYCFQCHQECEMSEKNSLKSFCDSECQSLFYS